MNITSAQSNWYERPADERFSTLSALREAAGRDKAECIARAVPVADVRAKAIGQTVVLNGKTNAASLSNWSFGQVAAIAGAPSGYLRTLPASLAADCLNHGFEKLEDRRAEHQLYFRAPRDASGQPDVSALEVRAVTSTDYARIHDVDIVERLERFQEQHPSWQLPMDWSGIRSGAFRGDRDMFVLMTDGGSIVEDPTLTGGTGQMFRGFILRNSEVGAAALSLQTFMFRFVCGNLCIWGATQVQTIRRRHVGDARTLQYKVASGFEMARRFAGRPASDDEHAIQLLSARELGTDREEVIQVGRAAGLTIPQATASYEQAEMHEHSPRSVWGYAQGITRASQLLTSGYQDTRHDMDRVSGQLLTAWTRKVLA